MHVSRTKWRSNNGKVYESVWLRESVREGKRVIKRNIANLKNSPEADVAAIELALKHKGDLTALGLISEVKLKEGQIIGGAWTLREVMRELGIEAALGGGRMGKLARWQVMARVLDQGSRLSATRLATVNATCDVLALEEGFDEDDLYENLEWLAENQEGIEDRLWKTRRSGKPCELFLYDVTSTYLEGDKNELGARGYNRDKKSGKKQIVIGLLCDEEGEPVSVQAFPGNTTDPKTFGDQVWKTSKRFGCEKVTLVGDRGMIKQAQIEQLEKEGFNFITAITKPQIETMLQKGILQLSLFDETLCEVESDGYRYIFRRNPARRDEIRENREQKKASLQGLVDRGNERLREHPKAKPETQRKRVLDRITRLRVESWLSARVQDRRIQLVADQPALEEVEKLDGCYVLKTDLSAEKADKEKIHARYKDLAKVEQAFRISKTGHLELRPVYVRKETSTRGHILVVMLSYLVRRHLSRAWSEMDVTVKGGLSSLQTLSAMEVRLPKNGGSFISIPEPREESLSLLKALNVSLPTVLPHSKAIVATHRKLQGERKIKR